MLRKIWSSLSYANVMSTIAVVAALGTGTAYAANTVFSTDIVDGEVKHADIAGNSVTSTNIYPGSVTNSDIHTDAVDSVKVLDESLTSSDLATNSVQGTEIADGAVTNFKIGAGAITHSKLGSDSIDGSNVASNSLGLADIVGIDRTGAISFTLSAGHCGTLALGEPGAVVGQAVLLTFTGATAVPTSVVFGGVKVTSADHIEAKACNVGASSVSVTNLGIRVVTFG